MLSTREAADFLRAHDNYLILTHKSPDGDTLGCAAGLCLALRAQGKTAALLENAEVTETYRPYVDGLRAAEGFTPETVVSVDVATAELLPENAKPYADKVDLAIDHHPSHECFAEACCVQSERAACGEIIYEIAAALGPIDASIALPLYVAVSTDTGCFVYSNVTANTHRVAAALIETGFELPPVNKRLFRTKSKKRLALEGRLLGALEFFDEGRIVVVQLPLSLQRELALTENDMDDISALGGQVEGTDCAVTMKEKKSGEWKISLRTGPRVNATAVCARFGGGGHRAASGCTIKGLTQEETKLAVVQACIEEAGHA